MILIKPSYEILTSINGEQILIDIEKAARTCYKSEDKIKIESNYENGDARRYAKSARVLINKIIKRGHEAMIEFGPDITVKFIVDRGVSHEMVRHRMASFAQESTRYVNYGRGNHMVFIIPSWLEGVDEATYKKQQHETFGDKQFQFWFNHLVDVEEMYDYLIAKKWTPQQARSVLPNSLKTEINIKANLREWRHIFKLRTASGAHPQMYEVMRPLLDEFKERIPIIFDDITY
jgi:thymidylate synthase (FAD)